MTILICKECGGKVSDKATNCPHCGAPVEISLSKTHKIKACPDCGRNMDIDCKECTYCGHPFDEDKYSATNLSNNKVSSKKNVINKFETTFTCTTCGRKLHKGVTFCPTCKQRFCNHCGTPIKSSTQKCPQCHQAIPYISSENWFDRNIISIIIAVIIFIGIGVVGVVIWGGYKFLGFDKESSNSITMASNRIEGTYQYDLSVIKSGATWTVELLEGGDCIYTYPVLDGTSTSKTYWKENNQGGIELLNNQAYFSHDMKYVYGSFEDFVHDKDKRPVTKIK